MKRLTKRIDGKAAFVHGTCYDPQQVCDFLAAYEDTGLEPEVCANYKQFEDEAMSKGVTFRRIVELMEAEKEGRLVVLPCNVGDVIFGYPFCWAEKTISELGILEWKAACIYYSVNKAGKTRATVRASVWKEHNGKEYAYLTEDIPFGDFGKTVFLTREKAEREKGCEYCNPNPYGHGEAIKQLITQNFNDKAHIHTFVRGNGLHTIAYPSPQDTNLAKTYSRCKIINYCPNCGAKMEEHHEAD